MSGLSVQTKVQINWSRVITTSFLLNGRLSRLEKEKIHMKEFIVIIVAFSKKKKSSSS